MRVVVLGGGGHAGVVIDALRAAGEHEPAGVLDRSPALKGLMVEGVAVLGDDGALAHLAAAGIEGFVVGVGYARDGDLRVRRRLFETACAAGLRPVGVRHPRATVAGSARLGVGTVVFAGAIVNPRARVGANAILNTGCIVEHDGHVGDDVHIAPGAVLCGGVVVGDAARVGAGARVREGVAIGRGAVIAMGAVVVGDVGEGELVVGVPARRRAPAAREVSCDRRMDGKTLEGGTCMWSETGEPSSRSGLP